MVSEDTQIEPHGKGYSWTPGIYSQAQIDGWCKVTDAVHAEGGVIFAQLWRVGRVSHAALQPDGAAPVAPSAILAQKVKAFIETGPGVGTLVEPSMPRELTVDEIKELVALYAQAAKNAMSAGFDGVESPRQMDTWSTSSSRHMRTIAMTPSSDECGHAAVRAEHIYRDGADVASGGLTCYPPVTRHPGARPPGGRERPGGYARSAAMRSSSSAGVNGFLRKTAFSGTRCRASVLSPRSPDM